MIKNFEINVTKSRAVLVLLFLSFSVHVFGQECGGTTNKKALKLYEKGTDSKNKKAERIEYLNQAVDQDAEFVAPRWELAYLKVRDALRREKPFAKAEGNLLKVVEKCPDYHSSAYYFLGKIYFTQKEYEKATNYLKKFLDFKSSDRKKFDRKYEEYKKDAELAYKEASFFADAYKNPKPFDPKKLTPVSTSNEDEYLPLITPDQEQMFFTRRRTKAVNERGGVGSKSKVDFIERFSASNITGTSFDKGEPLPTPFNTNDDWNYGGSSVTVDNKHLFLTICKPAPGMPNCDIYSSDYVYGKNPLTNQDSWYWTELKNMGPNINSKGWEAQPTISKDGKILLFASLREGSQGIDIYQSKKQSDGSWGAAQNIGAPINSPDHDKTPFFHSDSRTLYFASKGHINFGGYDVFYARMNENGTWEEPKNIGHPINTESDEHGYIVSTDGKRVYFSSKQVKGVKTDKVNIFYFDLYKEARPDEVILIKGEVKSKSGKPLKNATVEISKTNSDKVESFEVDEHTGQYTAIVTADEKEDFVVNVKGEDVAFNTYVVSGKPPEDGFKTELKMEVQEVEVGKPYEIENIVFATNSAELNSDAKAILDAFAEYMSSNETVKVSIEGHTDNVGDPYRNLVLSTERSYSVMDYLQFKGIHKDRLQFKGYGDTKPKVSNSTPTGRATNRRTEFIILSK